ncbi:MAG: BolA family protein [Pseudomonadota bacterium]
MNRAKRIEQTLTVAFQPLELKVDDESHLHAGHAGAAPGGETHYRVRIVSERFRDTNRLARHRMINEALAGELENGLHALAIKAFAPEDVTTA